MEGYDLGVGRPHTERVYVKVTAEFDSTGYMQPVSITWSDGRTFPIEKVQGFRPAGMTRNDLAMDYFTVLIHGNELQRGRGPGVPRPGGQTLPRLWLLRE